MNMIECGRHTPTKKVTEAITMQTNHYQTVDDQKIDDQLEELRNENKQLKIENETLIKENTELKLQIEKLQKND